MALFGKKQKKPELQLRLFTESGQEICLFLPDFKFKEQVILEHSKRFFNDPNPCYIHRGAVTVRLLAELEEELSPLPKGYRLDGQNIPQKLTDWSDEPICGLIIIQ